jgi:hypothetical protein
MAPRYSAGPGEGAVPAMPSEVWDGLPLIARLAGPYRRLRAADRRRPWIADTALVLVIVAQFCLPDLLTRDPGPRAVTMAPGSVGVAETLLLQAGLVLPLLWRRRAPVTVFVLVTGAFIVQWSAEVWLQADVATLIALYSLVRHAPLRYLPWAFAAAAGSLAMVPAHTSSHVSIWYALFFLYSTIVAAAALGELRRTLGVLRDQSAAAELSPQPGIADIGQLCAREP